MKRIYLAAAYDRHLEMQAYANDLRQQGYQITSRWIWGNGIIGRFKTTVGYEKSTSIALENISDIMQADTFIFFIDNLKKYYKNHNHSIEFGIALGIGCIKIVAIGQVENLNIYHCINNIENFEDWESFKSERI